jgi:hypothetical protein
MKTLLTSILLVTILGCSGQPSDNRYRFETIELSSFKNIKEGFSISYPTKWDTTNLNREIIFMAYEKRRDSSDKFRENMNIYKVKTQRSMSLEDILKQAENAFTSKYKNDAVLKSTVKQNNYGLKYALLETFIRVNGTEVVSCESYFRRGDYVYVLGGAFDNSQYPVYHRMLSKIINEFQFIK